MFILPTYHERKQHAKKKLLFLEGTGKVIIFKVE